MNTDKHGFFRCEFRKLKRISFSSMSIRVHPWLKIGAVFFAAAVWFCVCAQAAPLAKPNIVFILADDLGYGDVHCLNPARGKIATPCMDKLASQSMTFTEAHSSSAVCTPSRYSILTGRYNWRSHLQSGVLQGFSPPLIAPDRLTVAELLQQHGYRTACIGKWHLGLTFAGKGEARDLSQPIKNNPTTLGFDYFFGLAASLDMPPFAFIENDHFTQLPTVTKKWVRTGIAAPDFEAAEVLPELTRKAKEFIAANAATNGPFFLYLPLTSPHTPLVPMKEWQGKSGLGDYGDFVMETDWAIGEVLAALDKNGIAGQTLVLLASDNGCAPYIGVTNLEQQGHFPSADRRGYKADIWDGGHHIPLFVRWPGKVKAGATCDQLVCLVDFMATCADILGETIPDNAGEDSVSLLPAMLGTATTPLHEAVVSHSINGSFAIRQGRWKLELCPDSGGWSAPRPGSKAAEGLPPVQLYDMSKDVGERTNEWKTHPEIIAQLARLLEKYVADGRSTAGKSEANDGRVNIRKSKPLSNDSEGNPVTHD
jgi:arylsulfatase A-like enzyme